MESFSSLIKKSLITENKVESLKKTCCLKTILLCFLTFKNYNLADNNRIELKLEESDLADFIYHVLKKLNVNFSREKINNYSGKNTYKFNLDSNLITSNLNKLTEVPKNKCCKHIWLKTAFLCTGYISDPNKNYHLA